MKQVRYKSETGSVIREDKSRDGRVKYLVQTAKGQKVVWFADKCREIAA